MMRTLLNDFKYGARTYAKTPGFTLAAMVTLALGIGATAVVFSIADAILLKPLPYPDAARIVFPWRLAPKRLNLGFNEYPWDRSAFLEFSRQTKAFESMAAFQYASFNLTGAEGPVRVDGVRASAGLFPSLGVTPQIGRTFTAEEDSLGHQFEVVLGDTIWRERFHADPAIAGKSIAMNGLQYTVIGVMPPGFSFPRAAEMPPIFNFPHEAQLWVPIALEPGPPKPAEPSELAVIGKLRAGVSIEQAQAEEDVFSRIIERRSPGAMGWFDTKVTPMAQQAAGDTRRPLLLLLGAVGVVLLIACSNVAGLLLARALARSHEFALRAALGAERSRLMSQIVMETVPLSLAGGAAGLLLARALLEFVKAFGPAGIPRLQEASIDWRVAAFAMAVTLAAGILSSLAPAIAGARKDLADTLREGGRRTIGGGLKTRKALLVSQTALALVLTMAAGLLTESFVRLLHVNPGFRADHVLTFEVSIPGSRYPDNDHVVALYTRALAALREAPGVDGVGIGEVVPMDGAPDSTGIRIPGRARDPQHPRIADYTFISPGYFSAMRIPLIAGREFLDSDTKASQRVVIINQAMAKAFWPGEDPIGQQVGPGSPLYPVGTIVGVVADFKHMSLRQKTGPEMYVPYTQQPWTSMLTFQAAVRTKGDPASMTAAIRAALRRADADLPAANVATLSDRVSESMSAPRFTMYVLIGFGVLALALASIGMYGVVAYSVRQRTREIGIRMALGAGRGSVLAMIFGQAGKLAGMGIAIGVAASLAVTRLISTFLFGVSANDPLTFAGVIALLAAISALAAYVPARRATRVDPMAALHDD